MDLSLNHINVGPDSISLMLPRDEESSLNDAIAGDCVDPYWGKLWDSAADSAACVLQSDWGRQNKTIELGCGAGLLGIAGLMAGLDVTFSDHEPQAVDLAVSNAEFNGFKSRGLILDWGDPSDEKFDVLLASDVLYEQESHAKLLLLAERMLHTGGSFHIGDPGRQLSRNFLNLANDGGWHVQIFDKHLQPCLAPFTNQFQWLILKR